MATARTKVGGRTFFTFIKHVFDKTKCRIRYNWTQIGAVFLVTAGVMLTTMSASKPKASKPDSDFAATTASNAYSYTNGILILLLALVLSGLLGIVQDQVRVRYGSKDKEEVKPANGSASSPIPAVKKGERPAAWQEQLFYLHFLSLPMFYSVRQDLFSQFQALSDGPVFYLTLPASSSFSQSSWQAYSSIPIPATYLALLLNSLTQLVCLSGVHRLTHRVSSLTVTLLLVVRKAVSLIISVTLFGAGVEGDRAVMMWGGALLVFLGTFMYSLGGAKSGGKAAEAKKKVD